MINKRAFHFIALAVAASLIAATTLPTKSAPQTAWWPKSGAVILAGGNISSATFELLAKKMITLAGGPDALVVIIPTADSSLPAQVSKSESVPRLDDLIRVIRAEGARNVVILHTRDRKTANSEAFVTSLRSAKAVWITGGQPLLLEKSFGGTLVERELRALLDRGGVVAGDSAGAIAIGFGWLTWLPDPFGKRVDDFGILPLAAVTPHANAARGYTTDQEVLKYMSSHSGVVGIDIDEDTALVLKGSAGEVIGQGGVSIIDVAKIKSKPYARLTAGDRRDFSH